LWIVVSERGKGEELVTSVWEITMMAVPIYAVFISACVTGKIDVNKEDSA
jgi:hypothetical protein